MIDWQKKTLLPLQPLSSLVVLTLWTVTILAGVVAVALLRALGAHVKLPAENRSAAGFYVLHDPQMGTWHSIAELGSILTAMQPEDIGYFSHHRITMELQIAHDPVDGFDALLLRQSGYMGIDGSGRQRTVSEIRLEQANIINAGLKQVSSEGMPQGVDRDMLINAAFDNGLAKSRLQSACIYRYSRMAEMRAIRTARKEPDWITVCGPVLPKQFKGAAWEWHKTVLVAFPMAYVKHLPGAVYVANFKIDSFLQSQATGINGGEADPVAGIFDKPKYLSNFLDAEHGRELLLTRRPHYV
jgi:hypothetical protein